MIEKKKKKKKKKKNRDSRDGDGDGIPDSSDKCTDNSYHRCFKEGDTNTPTTTTHQQQHLLLLLIGLGTRQDSLWRLQE